MDKAVTSGEEKRLMIPYAMDNLKYNIEGICASVETLQNRLSSVLSPPKAVDEDTEKEEENPTPLGSDIQDLGLMVKRANRTLKDIIRQLEI